MVDQTQRRRKAQRRGHWAEWFAALALMFKGYRIVALRHKTKLGEIDIVARKGDLIAMVEVKSRSSVQEAVDAVTPTTRKRINAAADLWCAQQTDYNHLSIRFDVMAVVPGRWPIHFPDAF